MQNPNQMISKTMIFDEVALGLQRTGLTEAEIRARVEDTLKICGLYPFRNWPISALSFGQKKRVTIASVLVHGPGAYHSGRADGRARISDITPTLWSSCAG